MASKFDESEFIDSDFEESRQALSLPVAAPASAPQRPPTREEIEAKVSDAHTRLAELKRVQEQLERERATLEDARRRRIEFQTGRAEMLNHLTRGIGLIHEAEFTARRDAEQMTKTLVDLRDALQKTEALHEEHWTNDNWQVELSRALTTLENARMEFNSARLKWPLLDGATKPEKKEEAPSPHLRDLGFWQICRIGLAFSLPVTLALVIGLTIIAILVFQR